MHLTVADALKIGPLIHAKILAGSEGLSRQIKSIDVIEVPDAANWFRENSLLVTTFYALRDDIDAQLKMLDDIQKFQGAGLIIFSPKRYLSGLDQRLIKRAEQLALPLLQMPDVSYVDVIMPLMSAILDKNVQTLEFSLEIQRQMNGIILKNKGAEDIVYTLSTLVGNSVLLADESHWLKAFAPHTGSHWSTDFFLKKIAAANGPLCLTSIWRRAFLESFKKNFLPQYQQWYHEEQFSLNFFYPLHVGEIYYGTLVVINLEKELDLSQLIAVQSAATTAIMVLIQERAVRSAEERVKLDLFNELFLGNYASEELIKARAAKLGIDLEKLKVLMAFAVRGTKDRQQLALDLFERAMKSYEQKAVMVKKDELFIVFLDFPLNIPQEVVLARGRQLAERLRGIIGERLPESKFVLGLSDYCTGINDLPGAYQQLLAAVDYGPKMMGWNKVITYSEIEGYILLKDLIKLQGFEKFYQRHFGKLLQYDQDNDAELAPTFEAFLLSGGLKQKAAEQLYIHRNSLNYRLHKIEDIIGCKLDVELNLFPFQLAAVYHRLSKNEEENDA